MEQRIAKLSDNKKALEHDNEMIEMTVNELGEATATCSEIAKHSSRLTNQAKRLVGQYGDIADRSREIADAFEYLQIDVDSKPGRYQRIRALRSIFRLTDSILQNDILTREEIALIPSLREAITQAEEKLNATSNGFALIESVAS